MSGNRHPNVHDRWRGWSNDQTLHLVSPYSNPLRWVTRRKIFNTFVDQMSRTANVKLYVIEIAYGNRPYEVHVPDNVNLIQVRTNDIMWHKENAINVAVQHFPYDYKYGGYCDGDFHFTRHDWALEAIHLLQFHHLVQLFSSYADLSPSYEHSNGGNRPYRVSSSFMYNYFHQDAFKARRSQPGDTYYVGLPKTDVFPFGYAPGATGGAWSWRREAFDTFGGLLDTHIVGGADWNMAFGLVGLIDPEAAMAEHAYSSAYLNAALCWQEHALQLNKNIGCVDNFAVHYFHGTKQKRSYSQRWQILKQYGFDPCSDLVKDWQGLWHWAGNKPQMERDVMEYMLSREEDSTELEFKPLV